MATRNLTTYFNRFRNAVQNERARSGSIAGAGGYDTTPLHAAGLAPVYVDRVDEINRDIDDIKERVSELKTLHRERLMQIMEDRGTELEQRIDILTSDITARFNRAGQMLKQIASTRQREQPHSADDNVRLNIQRSLAARLHQLSTDFRRSQKEYLAQLKQHKSQASLDVFVGRSGQAAPEEVDTGLTATQLQEMGDMEDLSQERDEEIRKIVESIQQLSEMFKELNVLVVEQGSLLDRIDYNMDMTLERVKAGVTHIERAEEYQKSARPLKCIVVLMVLIIIMVIILIVRKT